MESFLLYLLKVSICTGFIYFLYIIIYRNFTFHNTNRFYLIIGLILSFLLPLISINFIGNPEDFGLKYIKLKEIYISNINTINNEINIDVLEIISAIYISIATLFLIRFIIQLMSIYLLKNKAEKLKPNIYHIKENAVAFSFFNNIFINPYVLTDEEQNQIIQHEKAHIKELHTLDIILFEVSKIILWFNPFVWLLKSSLQELHEFIADKKVLEETNQKSEYKQLLLKELISNYEYKFVNNFNFSMIQRRIKMISQLPSPRIAALKYLAVIPIIILLLMFNNHNTVHNRAFAQIIDTSASKDMYEFVKLKTEPKVDLQELSKLIVYPEEARKEGLDGKIILRVLVTKEGKAKKAVVESATDKIFIEPALKAIKDVSFEPGIGLDGKPVECYVSLPIVFKLRVEKSK